MKKAFELKNEREQKLEQLDKILKVAEDDEGGQTRDYTDEETNEILALKKEIKSLNSQIDKQEAIEDAQKERAAVKAPERKEKPKPEKEKIRERYSFMKAIRSGLPENWGEYRKLEGVEKEMHEEGVKDAKAAGVQPTGNFVVPSMLMANDSERRDLNVTTTTDGGHTVETELRGLIPYLAPRLVVEAMGATIITDLQGNVDFPRNDAQGSVAWETEVADANESSPTFDKVSLTPKRLSAFTAYSKQLLRQSSLSVENFVRGDFASIIGQELDSVALNGGGSNEPTGIYQASGVNTVTGGAAISHGIVIDMETEVAADNADMGSLGYVTTPQVRGQAKQTVKETGQALYVWGDGGELNGYRAMVSNLAPKTLGAGSNHAMIFGNWAELLIGQWGGLDILVDPYSLSKKAQVQIVVNLWVDIALRHATSFCRVTNGIDIS